MIVSKDSVAGGRVFTCLLLMLTWLGSAGFTINDVQVYSMGHEFAESGRTDFAFMYFNELLRSYPASAYRERALFAVGEYYHRISSLRESKAAFRSFVANYPDSELKFFALAYLLDIARKKGDELEVESLGKQIVDLQRVSFVFRDKKEVRVLSPLNRRYKAVIQIDKIEFFQEGNLFATVSY